MLRQVLKVMYIKRFTGDSLSPWCKHEVPSRNYCGLAPPSEQHAGCQLGVKEIRNAYEVAFDSRAPCEDQYIVHWNVQNIIEIANLCY